MTMQGLFLLPRAGEGGPTKSGGMRALGAKRAVGDVARFRKCFRPTPLRGATFSRGREKGSPASCA